MTHERLGYSPSYTAGKAIGADGVGRPFSDPEPSTLVEILEACIVALPEGWKLMMGRQAYDPIPGSPGDVDHPGLAGQMIWWAVASEPRGEFPGRIISEERAPSLERALGGLTQQLKRLAVPA